MGLALRFELRAKVLDTAAHLGYEHGGIRLRLAGVLYFTGRVLVGVQYHPHPAVLIAFVRDSASRYAFPDSVHRDAQSTCSVIHRHLVTGRAALSHGGILHPYRTPRW